MRDKTSLRSVHPAPLFNPAPSKEGGKTEPRHSSSLKSTKPLPPPLTHTFPPAQPRTRNFPIPPGIIPTTQGAQGCKSPPFRSSPRPSLTTHTPFIGAFASLRTRIISIFFKKRKDNIYTRDTRPMVVGTRKICRIHGLVLSLGEKRGNKNGLHAVREILGVPALRSRRDCTVCHYVRKIL